MRLRLGILTVVMLLGCGPSSGESTLPDETDDLQFGAGGASGATLEGTRAVGPDISGTRWKWLEAHCTEGPLDLASRGFAAEVRASLDDEGVLFMFERAFEKEGCVQTVALRAIPGEAPDSEWQMTEEAHVSLPVECGVPRERDRPGNVRMRGDFLEIYVQRSKWCNGFEVRMVFAPAPEGGLEPDQSIRHYAAHFNRQDLPRLMALFSDTASLVEPFSPSETGTTRHEGRKGVEAWYAQLFAGVPWLALRLTSVDKQKSGQYVANWEYMDPRVTEPFKGKNSFTVAGGEIFETQIELSEQPNEAPDEASEGGAVERSGGAREASEAKDE